MSLLTRLASLALLLLPLASHAVAPQALDQVAVIVNDGVILKSEIAARMEDLRFQARQRDAKVPTDAQLFGQARDQLVLEALQLQLANRNNLRADETQVNAMLTRMAQANGLSLEAFRDKLDKTPGTRFSFVRDAVQREQIIDRLRKRRMGERIKITEADVNQFLATPAGAELNRLLDEQLKPVKPGREPGSGDGLQVLVTQLLVPVPEEASASVKAAAQALAEQLLAAQKTGLDPAAVKALHLARTPEVKEESLDWRAVDELPSPFIAPIQRLMAGGEPALTRTSRGWHLLWIIDKREQQSLGLPEAPALPAPTTVITQRKVRHILMRPTELQSSDDVHEAMKVVYQQLKAGGDFAEQAKLKSQDPGSAVKGGELGWVSPGEMVPEFERKVKETPIGTLSEPFQSPFGWHVLQVLEERQQDMRANILKDRARQILYGRAYDEELAAWLRELRAEAYVEYRGQ